MILDDIKENNPWYASIVNNLKMNNYFYYHNQYNNYYIKLNNGWDDIYSNTSKKFVRRNISLAHNRIEKDYGKDSLEFIFNPNWDLDMMYSNISQIKGKTISGKRIELDNDYEKRLIQLLVKIIRFCHFGY